MTGLVAARISAARPRPGWNPVGTSWTAHARVSATWCASTGRSPCCAKPFPESSGGSSFVRNFEAVNRQLLSLDAQLSATPSSLAEKEEAVSRLNDSATAIFAQWDSVLSSQQELAPTAASTIKDISFADSLKEATILIANVLNKGTLCLWAVCIRGELNAIILFPAALIWAWFLRHTRRGTLVWVRRQLGV